MAARTATKVLSCSSPSPISAPRRSTTPSVMRLLTYDTGQSTRAGQAGASQSASSAFPPAISTHDLKLVPTEWSRASLVGGDGARAASRGEAAFVPGSRRPKSSPSRVPAAMEDEIVALHKSLAAQGLDAGTPHHPVPRAAPPPAPKSRGPICVFDLEGAEPSRLYRAPAPQAAQMLRRAEPPNECWQADTTHWSLSGGTDVEVRNIIGGRSRPLVASRASLTTKAADVVATFEAAATEVGLPASLLTDNGAIFASESRGGRCAIETLLLALGVTYKHGRPYRPHTYH